MNYEGHTNYRIDIYKLGFPGKVIKTFFLKLRSALEANDFAESVIKEDDGFQITQYPDTAF